MKKSVFLSFALTLLLLLLLPTAAFADRTIVDSGNCGAQGDNVRWKLYNDGELVISGEGDMANYSSSSEVPWHNQAANIVSLIIEDGVTSIGDCAFGLIRSLTSVTIPESVIRIGNIAFDYCTGLTSVTIPANVSKIGPGAFSDCTGLTEFVVEEGNTHFCTLDGCLLNKEKTVFIYFTAGKSGSFTIPDGVTSIRSQAFVGCTGLTSVTIPDSVTTIGGSAFQGSGLTSVTIPASVTSISGQAFAYCKDLTSVIFRGDMPSCWFSFVNVTATVYYPADNETYTADSMQDYGGKLTWVAVDMLPAPDCVLPASLLSIDDEAFFGCVFRYVRLPDGAESIGSYAFAESDSLAYIYIPESVTDIDPDAFDKVERLTILGVPGSTAAKFAEAKGFTFLEG